MNSVLFGNGIVIQYGGGEYTNASIIRRALANIDSGTFPDHIYPALCADCLLALHGTYPDALRGDFDSSALAWIPTAYIEANGI